MVDSYPIDVSPYGVRGLGGNARDWCVDVFIRDAPIPADRIVRPNDTDAPGAPNRITRGGSWLGVKTAARCAHRSGDAPSNRQQHHSVRLVRRYPSSA